MKVVAVLLQLILLIPSPVNAQLCNGNLGDPIVNITFGTSRTPLSKSATNLSYIGGCPYDAESYTIQNLIFGCGENPSAKS